MSDVGHSWDVFTTDSPYTAVLEGLPTQFALALPAYWVRRTWKVGGFPSTILSTLRLN